MLTRKDLIDQRQKMQEEFLTIIAEIPDDIVNFIKVTEICQIIVDGFRCLLDKYE